MPIYEYRCQACGHNLEAFQKLSDEPLTLCPECGENSLKKRVSAAGFRLKGGGWYETDFKSGSKRNVSGASEGGDGKSAAGGTAGSGDSGSGGSGSGGSGSGDSAQSKPDSGSASAAKDKP